MAGPEKPGSFPPEQQRIAVRPVGLRDRRIHLLPLRSVLYFFSGGAARQAVSVPGYAREVFRRGRIYARTQTSVFATCFNALADLTRFLDPLQFQRARRGIVVSVAQIEMLDCRCGRRMAGFVVVDAPIEWLPIGRSFVRRLGDSVGIPVRGARRRARREPLQFPDVA